MQTKAVTQPPIAEREPHITRIHSTELNDDYAWMRDHTSPALAGYLLAHSATNLSLVEEVKVLTPFSLCLKNGQLHTQFIQAAHKLTPWRVRMPNCAATR